LHRQNSQLHNRTGSDRSEFNSVRLMTSRPWVQILLKNQKILVFPYI
jgi:hypothetical protein